MNNFRPKNFEDPKKSVTVFAGLCKGCGICIEKCPVKAIAFSQKDTGVYYTPAVEVDIKKCIGCGICETVCPDCALLVEKNND